MKKVLHEQLVNKAKMDFFVIGWCSAVLASIAISMLIIYLFI